MFTLNLKKEWKLHKSLLITFFIITLALFLLIFATYLVLKYADLPKVGNNITIGIWMFASAIVTMLSTIFPIVLMYLVLKNDVGKNRIHYTVYTPQSILSWFLPKLLFVILIQFLFAITTLGTTFMQLDISNQKILEGVDEKIVTLLSSTFAFGVFGVISLCTALYYSFRKKGHAWLFMTVSVILYFIISMIPSLVFIINEGPQSQVNPTIGQMLILWGVDVAVGWLYLGISLILFDKKVEY